MIIDNKFPCTGCGACCKRIGKYYRGFIEMGYKVDDKDSEWYFPYKWDETYKCEKLTSDNKCSVYDNRPLICNMEKYALAINFSLTTFYKLQIDNCNKIMNEDNISESFRIK